MADTLIDSGNRRATPGPEWVYSAILAAFGAAMALVLPPFQAPDEFLHFYRAYHVSEGHWSLEDAGNGWGGAAVPDSLIETYAHFAHLPFRADEKVEWAASDDLEAMRLAPDRRTLTPLMSIASYGAVPYLPQAAGIATARLLGMNPLRMTYAGRFGNLAFALALIWLAIRVAPAFKHVLGASALLPVSVQGVASNSADASVIAGAFLLFACLLHIARGGKGRVGRPAGVLTLAAGALVGCGKFPYAMICIIYLAAPVSRLGSRGRHWALGTALALVTFGAAAATIWEARAFTPDSHATTGFEYECNPGRQLERIIEAPGRYAWVCLASLSERMHIYLDMLGLLGWVDTPVNPTAIDAFLALLVGLGLVDGGGRRATGRRLGVFSLLAACLGGAGILTALYLWWSPVGGNRVEGFQGRYLVPLLPTLLLPLSGLGPVERVRVRPATLMAVCGGACVAVQVVSLVAVADRYYVPVPVPPAHSALAMATGLVVFGAAVAWSLTSGPSARRHSPAGRPAHAPFRLDGPQTLRPSNSTRPFDVPVGEHPEDARYERRPGRGMSKTSTPP